MAQSEESITLMTPYGVLSIYLLTVTDSSPALWMTPYHPSSFRAGVKNAL
ncbi:hypothetical protein [Dialister invisus]